MPSARTPLPARSLTSGTIQCAGMCGAAPRASRSSIPAKTVRDCARPIWSSWVVEGLFGGYDIPAVSLAVKHSKTPVRAKITAAVTVCYALSRLT